VPRFSWKPVRLERHLFGPRVFVFGVRIHEWHLGFAVLTAVAFGVDVDVLRAGWESGIAVTLASWLIVKDWNDLFPSRRDTSSWRIGLHRKVSDLRHRPRGDWLAPLTSFSVFAVGAVNVASTLTPNVSWRGKLLLDVKLVHVVPVFHALNLQAGIALVIASYYLIRRRRRAYQLSVVLLCLLAVGNLLKGLDWEEALLSLGAVAALRWGRAGFWVRHEPIRFRSAAWKLPLLFGGTFLASSATVWVAAPASRSTFDLILDEASSLLLFNDGPIEFHHPFTWVPLAVGLLAVTAIVVGSYVFFRPLAAPRSLPDAAARKTALEIVRSHGTDTLSFFKLRQDKHYLFSSDRSAFAGYQIYRGVMLVSGDPVGPVDAMRPMVGKLIRFAEQRGLQLAVLGASVELLELWREAGLRTLYLGDEAIVDATSFSLEGRWIRKVRQSVSRIEKAGFTSELQRLGDIGEAELGELEQISARWRAGEPERGFSMAMDGLRGEHMDESFLLVARDGAGAVRGFLHFVPAHGRPVVSLSFMRRDRETPNGLTEYLVVRAIEGLRDEGIEEVSLNFAAFARTMNSPASNLEKVLGRLLARFNGAFQLESLYRFNSKFGPRWEPRYFAWDGAAGLVRAGIAAAIIEGHLTGPKRSRHSVASA
jgi:lysyl-tRNA synthetase class 2